MAKTWLMRCRDRIADEIGEILVLGLVAAKLFGGGPAEPAHELHPAHSALPARPAHVHRPEPVVVARAGGAVAYVAAPATATVPDAGRAVVNGSVARPSHFPDRCRAARERARRGTRLQTVVTLGPAPRTAARSTYGAG